MRESQWPMRRAADLLARSTKRLLSKADQDRLRPHLAQMKVRQVQDMLLALRDQAHDVHRMRPGQRKAFLQTLPDQQALLLGYATAAWANKAATLFWVLEGALLPYSARARQVLAATHWIVTTYQDIEVWLWPYDGFSPVSDHDHYLADNDEDDEDD